jgi:ADP-ribosyl-[dinitrogen reductase] hydrolase
MTDAEDRAVGALLGLAVGDAIGTTLEFRPRDTYPPLTDMIGGGSFNRKPGEWTDDTAMALALTESLLAHPEFDGRDLLNRFVDWWHNGAYSCVGVCDDIGVTTRDALARWLRTGDPHAGSTDPQTAGNGSLMRLAPVSIRFWRDRQKLRDVAARQSKTTHGAPEAVDACVVFAEILADAIEGRPKVELLRPRHGPYAGAIGAIAVGSWRDRERDQISSSGYVAHSLEAALWCVGNTSDFAGAVFLAANLGDDADTTAAITGQLAGALYGASAIPPQFVKRLAWSERVRDVSLTLYRPIRKWTSAACREPNS